jgi:hypothetical protein
MHPTASFPSSSPDQFAKLVIDRWQPCPIPRFPPPEGPDTSVVPTKDCVRLNDVDRVKQSRPQSDHPKPAMPDHCPAVECEEASAGGRQSVRSLENVLWGAPALQGELLKLGFTVAQSTVAKYMVKRDDPSGQSWGTFLRHQRDFR